MSWNLENSFARALPDLASPAAADTVPAPQMLVFNHDLSEQLGLPLNDAKDSVLAALFSGQELPDGAEPVALAYSGHQFGHFSNPLGDGRALLLGEVIAPDRARFDIQFKGSGRTPFSRNGDGKCAIGPALREYLVSEAMAALGVKTTRSLAVVTTGETVYREIAHPGAIVTRVASSHIRVGTFQYAAANLGAEAVQQLADYSIARHYPEVRQAEQPLIALFEAIMDAQIALVASWINLGFVHGVMNTDNVAISGETIDYGPCAFIDVYSPRAVFSSIDQNGRYAFANQPAICRWNMMQLGNALAPAIMAHDESGIEALNVLLSSFADRYNAAWMEGMRRKLGLQGEAAGDFELASNLFAAMDGQAVDFTSLFRKLAEVPQHGDAVVCDLFLDPEAVRPWLGRWQDRLAQEGRNADDLKAAMDAVNPLYIPRNHLVEAALTDAEAGDMARFNTLLDLVRTPFAFREGMEGYAQPAPESFGDYVTFCGT